MIKLKALIFLSFILTFYLPGIIFGQGQANIWYFGQNAGLDFNPETPVALTDGALNTNEGCSVISDVNGNLLFYTDGDTVWNRQHQPMNNGTGLFGHYSSTQSALIVPQPGSNAIYYIFTTTAQGLPEGFRYSIVDLSLQGGMGDVTVKNRLLFTPSTEKLTAVHHANGRDIWVVAHKWESNAFYAYLVTDQGLQLTPVISRVGTVHEHGNNSIGQMKISPNANKIALVIWGIRVIEMFDFDANTGKVKNPNKIILAEREGFNLYGLEFSPNNKLIYVTDIASPAFPNQEIYQFEVFNEAAKIKKSKEVIGTQNLGGGLQLGPNGIIYTANRKSKFIGSIRNPNLKGSDCNFKANSVKLKNRYSTGSLPGFIQSYLLPPDPLVEMPNAFSPNNDKYNPCFRPLMSKNIQKGELQIYDRWGQLVYATDNLEVGWDGKINGENATTGVYYWRVRFEGENGKNGSRKGWVQLLR